MRDKILVTGASGNIGQLTLECLLKRKVLASRLIGLVRDPSKAKNLAKLGIELREGDYTDPTSLERAFKGVRKLMLTSTHAFTDRKTAHGNVIDAAVQTEVEHIVYIPIIRKENSDYVLQEVTKEDIFTEEKIRSSGLTYTFLKHPVFLDTVAPYIGLNALEVGIRVPVGNGKTGAASREDLAEAHAAVLAEEGHENKSYSLNGTPAVSFVEMAAILSKISGKNVPYIPISDQEYLEDLSRKGFPDIIAQFVLAWVQGMNRGEWEVQTQDLQTLIGHRPRTIEETFYNVYVKGTPQ